MVLWLKTSASFKVMFFASRPQYNTPLRKFQVLVNKKTPQQISLLRRSAKAFRYVPVITRFPHSPHQHFLLIFPHLRHGLPELSQADVPDLSDHDLVDNLG